MYRNGISQIQLIKFFKRIFHHPAFFIFYGQCLRKTVDFPNDSHITVEHTQTFFNWNIITTPDFPLCLIIIFNLHNLVAHTENCLPMFPLCLFSIRRIQILLQNRIQTFYSQQPLPHRSQHLDIKWRCVYILWQFLPDQLNTDTDDHVGIIPFQEKEISAFIIQRNRFPTVDLVGVDNNITLRCLSENPVQPYHIACMRIDDIFQHTARTDTRKLVHIPHKDQTGSCHNSF